MMRYLGKVGGCLKKFITLFIISFLFFNLNILSPEPFAITTFTNADRYGMYVNVSAVDASFIGNRNNSYLGANWGGTGGIKGSGDVNGDGYDDIILSEGYNPSGTNKLI